MATHQVYLMSHVSLLMLASFDHGVRVRCWNSPLHLLLFPGHFVSTLQEVL